MVSHSCFKELRIIPTSYINMWVLENNVNKRKEKDKVKEKETY